MEIMGTVERTVTFYVCERCGHEWYPRGANAPTVCPNCKSPYWNKPRQTPKATATSGEKR